MVIVEVTGERPLPLPPPPPPPHAESIPSAAQTAASNSRPGSRRRLRKPKIQTAKARTDQVGNGWDRWGVAAARVSAVMVRMVVTAAPDGVTVVGENEHPAPGARPEQLKATCELKPFCGVTVRVTVPCPPEVRFSDEGDAVKVKLGGGMEMV